MRSREAAAGAARCWCFSSCYSGPSLHQPPASPHLRSRVPRSRWSFTRPGVPITTSTPRRKMLSCRWRVGAAQVRLQQSGRAAVCMLSRWKPAARQRPKQPTLRSASAHVLAGPDAAAAHTWGPYCVPPYRHTVVILKALA